MRDVFVTVADLIEYEAGDNPLALGVLGDLEWHVQVDQTGLFDLVVHPLAARPRSKF